MEKLMNLINLLNLNKEAKGEFTENGLHVTYDIGPNRFFYSVSNVEDESSEDKLSEAEYNEFKKYIDTLPEWIFTQATEMFENQSEVSLKEFDSNSLSASAMRENISLYKDCVRAIVIDEIQDLADEYGIDLEDILD